MIREASFGSRWEQMQRPTIRHCAESESKYEAFIKSLPSELRERKNDYKSKRGWRTPGGQLSNQSESTKQGVYELTDNEATWI